MPDWPDGLFLSLAVASGVMLWGKTGVSPFVWLAWAFLHLEAVRVQTLAYLGESTDYFRRCYPHTRRAVAGEVARLMVSEERERIS